MRFGQDHLDRDALGALQTARLAGLLERLRASDSQWWHAKLATAPDEIASLDQLADLPFTEKAEFRDAYPWGMLAVPRSHTVRVHASSGTSGSPTIVGYTAGDLGIFAEVNARALACAGAGADDVVQVAYGYGLFTGGLGVHYGVEDLGATAVPASGGNPGFQVRLMADLGVTGLACTPSFALLLAERAAADGLLERIHLRWGLHGAEPWSEALRDKLQAAWGGYDACDIYGISEVIGPGVAGECHEEKAGLHIFEDHFYPEVVDPVTGDRLPDGELGELVVTTLTKEAQPVIRYRTRDLTRLIPDPCRCGRTLRRIERLSGRVDDMLIIRGVNVYPTAVESVLLDEPAVGGQFVLVVDRRGSMSELEARVELAHAGLAGRRDEVAARLVHRLHEVVRVRVSVTVLDPGSLPRQELGKARRVFDRTDDADPVG
jgi:phenylacetate-CoA ligase